MKTGWPGQLDHPSIFRSISGACGCSSWAGHLRQCWQQPCSSTAASRAAAVGLVQGAQLLQAVRMRYWVRGPRNALGTPLTAGTATAAGGAPGTRCQAQVQICKCSSQSAEDRDAFLGVPSHSARAVSTQGIAARLILADQEPAQKAACCPKRLLGAR